MVCPADSVISEISARVWKKEMTDVALRLMYLHIGAYAAAMGGVDAIAFTAGIGENNPYVRNLAMTDMEYMGITIDQEANKVMGDEKLISTPDSKVKVFVVPTNEELAIARETVALV